MESALKIKSQQGYLLIIAIVLIVIIGAIGTMLVYMFIGGSNSENNLSQSSQALYIAASGIEYAKRDLVSKNYDCASINGSGNYKQSFASGQFMVTGAANAASTTLNGAINTTASIATITLSNAADFVNGDGVVTIGGEHFSYTSKSGNVLQNVTRGVSGSVAATHSNGVAVSQNQCVLTSTGAIPTIDAPSFKRTVEEVLIKTFSGFSINGMYPTLVALGDVHINGSALIRNPLVWKDSPASPNYPGSTILTTGNLEIIGDSGGTEVCGCSTSACISACSGGSGLVSSTSKSSLQPDVVTGYTGGISSSNLFDKFFPSKTKEQIKSYAQTSSSTTQYFSSGLTSLASLDGIVGKTVWVNGSVIVGSSDTATIGSPDQPAILIIDGSLQFSGSPSLTVYGLVYIMEGYQNSGSGGISGQGEFVTEGGATFSGSGTLTFSQTILSKLFGLNPYLPNGYLSSAALSREVVY